jgi:hypothetical protein
MLEFYLPVKPNPILIRTDLLLVDLVNIPFNPVSNIGVVRVGPKLFLNRCYNVSEGLNYILRRHV